MKKVITLIGFMGLALIFLTGSCTNDKAGPDGAAEESAPPPMEDYVGRYDIVETEHDRYFDVYLQNDTLFLHSLDKGSSVMYAERNEVFDIPGHETKMRFLRNDAGEVDRVAFLTPKGRYTASKVMADTAAQ